MRCARRAQLQPHTHTHLRIFSTPPHLTVSLCTLLLLQMIFYLQARGLSRVQARSLLLAGWARDALSRVPSEGAKERAAVKAATLAPESASAGLRQERMMSI